MVLVHIIKEGDTDIVLKQLAKFGQLIKENVYNAIAIDGYLVRPVGGFCDELSLEVERLLHEGLIKAYRVGPIAGQPFIEAV